MTGQPEPETGVGAPPGPAEPAVRAVADAGPLAAEEAETGIEEPEPPQESAPADLAAVTAERDDYLGALQRMKADFDNFRRRVARQQEEQAGRAAGDLVLKLLPVLDSLDLAWAHLGADRPAAELDEGPRALSQVRQQLLDTLAREGLERVDAAGVPFDPTQHDAVAHVPADPSGPAGREAIEDMVSEVSGTEAVLEAEGTRGASVDEVMRAGYRWRGQMLRPAMVRVRG